MVLGKGCTQYTSKFGKCISDHRTGKGQFSFHFQRKAMLKDAQSTTHLHSSHTNKIMLKILQARLQLYKNCELPDVQEGFRKGRGTRDPISNIHWIIEKAREFQEKKTSTSASLTMLSLCVDHNSLWEILKVMGIPGHLTCLLRILYAGQEPTVRTGHVTQTGSKL